MAVKITSLLIFQILGYEMEHSCLQWPWLHPSLVFLGPIIYSLEVDKRGFYGPSTMRTSLLSPSPRQQPKHTEIDQLVG